MSLNAEQTKRYTLAGLKLHRDSLIAAIAQLEGGTEPVATTPTKRRGRKPKAAVNGVAEAAPAVAEAAPPAVPGEKKKRVLSPEAKANIAAAQRKRHAANKKAKNKTVAAAAGGGVGVSMNPDLFI
jgi:hypothetical protein